MSSFCRITFLFLSITINFYTTWCQIAALDIQFDHITTENISISTDYSATTCNLLDEDKIDCGFISITPSECLYRGCCYNPIIPNPNNIPWCYYTNNHVTTTQIGWLKVTSCIEAQSNAQFTSHQNNSALSYLSKFAITIKIVPPGGTSNPEYYNYAVMAVPCSNPVYAVNNNKELSWVIDMDSDDFNITGLSNYQDNWLGNTVATNRLENSCYTVSRARFLSSVIYDSGCTGSSIQISPILWAPDQAICEWNYQTPVGQDIEIYFGFDANKMYFCNFTTPNPTYSPTMEPSIQPTINPTSAPTTMEPSGNPTTVKPSLNPTVNPVTNEPSKRPTLHPITYEPSNGPTSNDMAVTDHETSSVDNTSVGKDDTGSTSQDDDMMIYIIICAVGGVLLICFFVVLCICRFKKRNFKQNAVDNVLEIEKMQSQSGITPMTTDNINIGEDVDVDIDGDFVHDINNEGDDAIIEMQNILDDSDQNDGENDLMYDTVVTKTTSGDPIMDGTNGNVVIDGDQSDENDDNNLYVHKSNGQTAKSADDDIESDQEYNDLYKTPKPTAR